MAHLTTDSRWEIASGTDAAECPPRYARMIPGSSVLPRPEEARAKFPAGARPPVADPAPRGPRHRIQSFGAIRELLPHLTGERLDLLLQVATDLALLAAIRSFSALFLPRFSLPWTLLPLFAALVTLFGFSEGLYLLPHDAAIASIVAILFRANSFATALVFLTGAIRPLPAAIAFAAGFLVTAGWRTFRHLLRARLCDKAAERRALIVGSGPIAQTLARALRADAAQHTTVCGFVDEEPLSPLVLGGIEDLDWLARAEFIDEVILAIPGRSALTRKAAETACRNHLDILAVPALPPGPWSDADIHRIGGIPVVTLHREPVPGLALFFKRILDVTGALAALVLASPVMALVSLLIRLDSPGPILYSAERTGAKGRPFRCHKFRSMVTDADRRKQELSVRNQRQGPIFKIDDDPRITRVGRFLRRFSLDELPQLWNVLRGDMSLVGPRPHPVEEVNHYDLPHYRRLDVKPGITGLWQITARSNPSFEVNMHLDLTYIENWSFWLDLRILASTVRVLFVPEGV